MFEPICTLIFINGTNPLCQLSFQVDSHPKMPCCIGYHLELVNSVDEPSFLNGRIYGKPDTLGGSQSRTQRHLDMAPIVFNQLVNAIHSVVPVPSASRESRNRTPRFRQRPLAKGSLLRKQASGPLAIQVDWKQQERQMLSPEVVHHEDLSNIRRTWHMRQKLDVAAGPFLFSWPYLQGDRQRSTWYSRSEP